MLNMTSTLANSAAKETRLTAYSEGLNMATGVDEKHGMAIVSKK
ncbi:MULTISPECIES: hypothetical protein [unclassified Erwinia]|nr:MULTISPECIES: hypothetical protein [unclassified Erwinia]